MPTMPKVIWASGSTAPKSVDGREGRNFQIIQQPSQLRYPPESLAPAPIKATGLSGFCQYRNQLFAKCCVSAVSSIGAAGV